MAAIQRLAWVIVCSATLALSVVGQAATTLTLGVPSLLGPGTVTTAPGSQDDPLVVARASGYLLLWRVESGSIIASLTPYDGPPAGAVVGIASVSSSDDDWDSGTSLGAYSAASLGDSTLIAYERLVWTLYARESNTRDVCVVVVDEAGSKQPPVCFDATIPSDPDEPVLPRIACGDEGCLLIHRGDGALMAHAVTTGASVAVSPLGTLEVGDTNGFDVAPCGDGFFVTWKVETAPDATIHGALMAGDGILPSTTFLVDEGPYALSSGYGNDQGKIAAACSQGRAFVAWSSGSGSTNELSSSSLSLDDPTTGGVTSAIAPLQGDPRDFGIVPMGDDLLLYWTSSADGAVGDALAETVISGVRLPGDGAAPDEGAQVLLGIGGYDLGAPSLAIGGDGGRLVATLDGASASDVIVTELEDGEELDFGGVALVSPSSTFIENPGAACGVGGCLAVWNGEHELVAGKGMLEAVSLHADGTPSEDGPLVIAEPAMMGPHVAPYGAGFFVAWGDGDMVLRAVIPPLEEGGAPTIGSLMPSYVTGVDLAAGAGEVVVVAKAPSHLERSPTVQGAELLVWTTFGIGGSSGTKVLLDEAEEASSPRVAYGGGTFLIVWTEEVSESCPGGVDGYELMGRCLSPDGTWVDNAAQSVAPFVCGQRLWVVTMDDTVFLVYGTDASPTALSVAPVDLETLSLGAPLATLELDHDVEAIDLSLAAWSGGILTVAVGPTGEAQLSSIDMDTGQVEASDVLDGVSFAIGAPQLTRIDGGTVLMSFLGQLPGEASSGDGAWLVPLVVATDPGDPSADATQGSELSTDTTDASDVGADGSSESTGCAADPTAPRASHGWPLLLLLLALVVIAGRHGRALRGR